MVCGPVQRLGADQSPSLKALRECESSLSQPFCSALASSMCAQAGSSAQIRGLCRRGVQRGAWRWVCKCKKRPVRAELWGSRGLEGPMCPKPLMVPEWREPGNNTGFSSWSMWVTIATVQGCYWLESSWPGSILVIVLVITFAFLFSSLHFQELLSCSC